MPKGYTQIQNIFFFGLLLAVTLAFTGLLMDFMLPLFWAAVLAVLFYPLYVRWQRAVRGRPSVASVLTVLTIVIIVILPLFLVGIAVTREAARVYQQVVTGEIDLQEAVGFFERTLPIATDYLNRFGIETTRIQEGLSNTAVTVSGLIASQAINVGQDAARFSALFFLMLYLLFFFLRDGDRLMASIIRTLPLGDARERRLFAKFVEVSRATIKGTLVVGVVQGTIGGLLFWMLGIGAPVFWGVIMTLLSLLPAIGSALVWVPAAIILMVQGEVGKGITLIIAGTLIIGLVDNILRPLLVGRDTKMPDYLILLSTLGGLAVFGLSGVVLGPVIAALFLVFWQMFEEEYGGLDDAAGPMVATEPPAAPPVAEAPSPPVEAPPPDGGTSLPNATQGS